MRRPPLPKIGEVRKWAFFTSEFPFSSPSYFLPACSFMADSSYMKMNLIENYKNIIKMRQLSLRLKKKLN
jgi:hypothetical protein